MWRFMVPLLLFFLIHAARFVLLIDDYYHLPTNQKIADAAVCILSGAILIKGLRWYKKWWTTEENERYDHSCTEETGISFVDLIHGERFKVRNPFKHYIKIDPPLVLQDKNGRIVKKANCVMEEQPNMELSFLDWSDDIDYTGRYDRKLIKL